MREKIWRGEGVERKNKDCERDGKSEEREIKNKERMTQCIGEKGKR